MEVARSSPCSEQDQPLAKSQLLRALSRQALNSSGGGDYTDFQGNLSQCLTSHSEEFLFYIELEFPLFQPARLKKYQLWLFEALRTASVGKSYLSAQRWESGRKKSLHQLSLVETHTHGQFSLFPELVQVFWLRAQGAFDHGSNLDPGSVPRGVPVLFELVSNSTTNQLFRKFLSFTCCEF